MKKNNLFIIKSFLCAAVVLGTTIETQASQSWYDWGTSGISSAMSSMRRMYNQLPSTSDMTDLARGTTLYKWYYQKYITEQYALCINDIQDLIALKESEENFSTKDIYDFLNKWDDPSFTWIIKKYSKNIFIMAMHKLLKVWYQECKTEQCIADIQNTFEGIKDDKGNLVEFSGEDRYKLFIKQSDTPYFKGIIEKYGKNIYVIAMNKLLEDYYNRFRQRGPFVMLKINETSGNIIKESIEKKEEQKNIEVQPLEISPKMKTLYNNMKKSCERSSDKDKYGCLLNIWKNHANDTWWNENSQKDDVYDNQTIANVVNQLLRDYYPMSHQKLNGIGIKQINFEDVKPFREPLF
jgi:hypothetical protein